MVLFFLASKFVNMPKNGDLKVFNKKMFEFQIKNGAYCLHTNES